MGATALAAGLWLSAVVLAAGDAREPAPAPPDRSLTVTSGTMVRRMALSFRALAADMYWIRAIQHYGRDRKSTRVDGRFELLNPLLDLTTTLDPQFNIAYRFGAIFLSQPLPSGPGRVDQAIALLQKGLRENPDHWQYAFDIGFIHYWNANDSTRAVEFASAADWFERAAAMPQAPVWLKPLAATTRAGGGDAKSARTLLAELARSKEPWMRQTAQRGLDQLRAVEEIDELQKRLDAYVKVHQQPPRSWADLIPGGPANAVPVDPAGVPYQYDASTQRIALSPASPLAPLPPALRAK